jgi:hypothetical protein
MLSRTKMALFSAFSLRLLRTLDEILFSHSC